MSISIGNLKFIDSFKFMAAGLDKLAENLQDKDDKFKDFNFVKKEYHKHFELRCQKGYYPI